ncbi:hypothetical protein GCM10010145_43040 [Streptomyces ruber]|uniref:Uncharacterized protein n=2 Tax=Streptomyces TaxID=1883 RepID=A0A918BHH6_9ACTN|nr:hypothetical protein [Streptomyces ruber]GGQ68718.1 hypothetical protein GCM10010145_43040 [Streptomyces ruber]
MAAVDQPDLARAQVGEEEGDEVLRFQVGVQTCVEGAGETDEVGLVRRGVAEGGTEDGGQPCGGWAVPLHVGQDQVTEGDPTVLVSSPITIVLYLVLALGVTGLLVQRARNRRRTAAQQPVPS